MAASSEEEAREVAREAYRIAAERVRVQALDLRGAVGCGEALLQSALRPGADRAAMSHSEALE
jgi:hypothetical protein